MFNFNNNGDYPNNYNNNRPSRNGTDSFSLFLGLIALILFIIYPVFDLKAVRLTLTLICFILVAFILFRFFSTNLVARRKENEAFLHLISLFKKSKNKNDDYTSFKEVDDKKLKKEEEKKRKKEEKENKKKYKYFNCPSCKTKIRVPRGKGKIIITCPNCKNKFEAKS